MEPVPFGLLGLPFPAILRFLLDKLRNKLRLSETGVVEPWRFPLVPACSSGNGGTVSGANMPNPSKEQGLASREDRNLREAGLSGFEPATHGPRNRLRSPIILRIAHLYAVSVPSLREDTTAIDCHTLSNTLSIWHPTDLLGRIQKDSIMYLLS